jgi:hypothetical protein
MKKIEKFPKLVVNEAKKLRELTTVEERSNLDFDTLDPTEGARCIYGQLTGNCHNDRAEELMKKSCSRVYKYGKGVRQPGKLNGSPKKLKRLKRTGDPIGFWSPIEIFIVHSSDKQRKNLLNYIKKRRHSLPT